MGVPVVSTSVSAIPELVEHEQTGLLVPPDNTDTLADAIEKLLVDVNLREKVIRQGKERVRGDFDNQLLTRKLAEVFISETTDRPAAHNCNPFP